MIAEALRRVLALHRLAADATGGLAPLLPHHGALAQPRTLKAWATLVHAAALRSERAQWLPLAADADPAVAERARGHIDALDRAHRGLVRGRDVVPLARAHTRLRKALRSTRCGHCPLCEASALLYEQLAAQGRL